jgi:WXG100 family type VII secretion target
MAKANVDPAELRRFAQDLNRFNNELTGLLGSLQTRLRGLDATWRDQEQRKFTEAFEQTLKTIQKFLDSSHEHSSFLNKKATAVEDYLKQR